MNIFNLFSRKVHPTEITVFPSRLDASVHFKNGKTWERFTVNPFIKLKFEQLMSWVESTAPTQRTFTLVHDDGQIVFVHDDISWAELSVHEYEPSKRKRCK